MNGFFRPVEWLPVATSAFAVSFLVVPFSVRVSRRYLALCAIVMLVQAAVGVLGFVLHVAADFEGTAGSMFLNVVHGAPPLAPLLFPNLVVLALIALWTLGQHLPEEDAAPEPAPAS